MNNLEFIKDLESKGFLPFEKIKNALERADRFHFVGSAYKKYCYEDIPLPIGFGQTISQPRTVIFMLNLLDVKKGQKILDVGSGSGWTTALLSIIVGESGSVFGVEKIPELVQIGKNNLKKINIKNAKIFRSEKKLGLLKEAPFDRIMVSASANNLPLDLIGQLKEGGVMVVPVKNSIIKIIKKEKIIL